MYTELVEIEPRELKFIFELKKQSSCSVRLLNKTNDYVAFKVKTTSPKRYSVRPNTGLIEPKSTCEFIVTMQAQRSAPLDMICRDKFLIQTVVVPDGTTEEMIMSSLFIKDDNSKYVEENKLKVVLVSPPHSPVLSPKNGVQNEAPAFAPHSPVLSPMNGVHKAPTSDASILENQIQHRVETVSPQHEVTEVVESAMESGEQLAAAKALRLETVQDVEEPELVKDIDIMKSKINGLELKLKEADVTISKLIEERKLTIQERESLKRELALLRGKKVVRRVQVGFPFFFVCMIALISAFLGYLLHW